MVVDPGRPDRGPRGSSTGRGQDGSSRPRGHTFKQLADAIDDAFARWDRSHLQEFTLADGRRLCDPDPDWEIEGEVTQDYRRVKLSRLHPGEQFAYVFDLGDDWAHLCTVGARRIDPGRVLGILPDRPLPYWGWGDIPDQYRRRWDDDDGESPPPRNPGSLIFHRSGLAGARQPPQGEGSRRCSQAPADQAITHLASSSPPYAAAGARAERPDPHHLEAIPSCLNRRP